MPWVLAFPSLGERGQAVITQGSLPGPRILESSGGEEDRRQHTHLPLKTEVLIRTTLLYGVLTWARCLHFITCRVAAAATGEVGTILVSLFQVKTPRLKRGQATRRGSHSPKRQSQNSPRSV